MVNKVFLIGNLGADPARITNKDGDVIGAKLSVATSRRYKKDDNWETATQWHYVACWGSQGKNALEYLKKGRQVAVEGRIESRQYEDQHGIKRTATEVISENIVFLGGGKESHKTNDLEEKIKEDFDATVTDFEQDEIPF